MADESRQASAECEVTPEMIEAGKRALIETVGDDRWTGDDDRVVTRIFVAMYNLIPASKHQ
jgi:hypothetical protein